MALKSLQINGFKSFARSMTLKFDPGITGIVGPNGSGKSNLTEALRWVMGEQSAKSLRGGKMEDIIFAGSDSQPPLNRAEVILKFDNRDRQLNIDRDEVEIRRRLFRGGESDCLINNQKVRLKDIVDLFMGSGLGKNSFAIISQGNVEKIFNSKPQQRRFIIEEPAGVASFKLKKQQAQQQLEKTDANLQRVSDIVQELARQVEPLKQQASIARDYQDQKQRYDKLEQLILATEIQQLNQQKQQWLTRQQQAKTHLQKISQQVNSADAAIAQNRETNQKLTSAIDKNQTQLTNLSRQLEVLKGQQALAQERSGFNATNRSNLTAQKSALEKKVTDLQVVSKQQEIQQQSLTAQIQTLQEKITTLEANFQADPQQINQKIKDLQAQYLELLQKKTSLRNQQNYLQQQQERLQHQQAQLQQVRHQKKQQLQQTQQKLQQNQQQYDHYHKSWQQNQDQLQQYQQQLVQYEDLLSTRQQHFQQAQHIWQQNQAELQSLKKIVEQHQGFYQGVRAVLNQQANLKGIIGVVAELITVPEKLQIAIQSAANTQLQSIVTATQTAARDAINFLHQKRAGRATFLPQNIIKSRKIINNQLGDLLTKDYFIGIASDLITYPVSLSNVMENLFGALLVVTDIDAAIKASNLTQHRFRIVTLKGDIISPGGAMTGGQNKNNVDLLSQRSRITKLQTWLKTAQVQLKEQQNLINKSQEQIQALIDTQKHQQQQAQNLEKKARDLQNLVQLQKQQEENDQQQLQAHDFQLQQLKQQLDLLQTQTAANEQSQHGVTVKIEQQQQLVTQQQALLTDFDAQKQVYEARLHTYKTQLALAENNLQNHQHLQQVNQKELQQVQQQYQNIQEQLQELNQNTSGSNSNQDYQSQIQDLKKQLNQLQTQIHDTKQQRQQIIQAAQTLQQQSTRLFELQKNWTNQQEDIAINLTNLTNQIRQKLSILEQQYQLSFEAAFQKIPSDWQLTPAKKQAQLLQKGIRELGEVNLSSLKDYAQVKDRYEFLTQQQNDLLTARRQLQKTMQEMDQEVSQRFEKMFNQVSAAFEVLFPQMFGGGHAQLVLDNPSNLLETGIEIVAQPPGKKLQRLSLLSGGERALTAITLLFAILKVHPVAFCVLDEVEASLDDANVERFANYLNKYDQKTQFIVITHRKGTMMHVNRLYGVTMQESGISSVITIALKQNRNEAS